jgi:hypothetical protein
MQPGYPPTLVWRYDTWGHEILAHEGADVGKAWKPAPGGSPAAWSAGNKELGIPESGVQASSSIEAAKSNCWWWVINNSNLPPGQAPETMPPLPPTLK